MDEDFLDVTAKTSKLKCILVVLIVCLLAFLGYYFIFEKDNFTLNNKTIEAGEKLNKNVSFYIKKKSIDKSKVKLNLSKVDTDKPGDYKISASYKGKVKYATVKVVDTTPPIFKTKKLIVEKGDHSFYLGNFLSKCEDISKPCLVNYKNEYDERKVEKIGTYNIKIVVSDVYNNKKEAEVTLEVVEEGEAPEDNSEDFDDETESTSKSSESTSSSSNSSNSNSGGVKYKSNSSDKEQEMDDFIN